ncbi:hypothetical protein H6F88_18555 [Oculatella sp. FACHB-28]|uniref:hypothetical protein n=1 Tax=Oculatella sp. FACHB-28 TaxID=2692845 RepID=UPI001689E3EA|nr:hypothetical protein [Oculatella sp. FACHB-28]MBD2057994.1 hypothetical protein [Oculatella sp. FACHB-28]
MNRFTKPRWFAYRSSLVLLTCFILSFLLVMLPAKLSGSSSSQPALLYPIRSPNSPERSALEHRPLPLSRVEIPDEVKTCIESGAERVDRLGTVQDRGKTFYLLAAYSDFVTNDPFNASDELIAIAPQEGCIRLVDSQSIRQPLSVYLSPRTAQSLEEQRFRRYITLLGGADQLQQQLSDRIDAAKGSYLLSKEQVQALRQLHIQIPSIYQLLQPDTFLG